MYHIYKTYRQPLQSLVTVFAAFRTTSMFMHLLLPIRFILVVPFLHKS